MERKKRRKTSKLLTGFAFFAGESNEVEIVWQVIYSRTVLMFLLINSLDETHRPIQIPASHALPRDSKSADRTPWFRDAPLAAHAPLPLQTPLQSI
jgi:hypothetical protein